jgi:hypothetical protein
VEDLETLERLAALLRLGVPREDLERWAPLVLALYRETDRFLALPLEGREPAFTPLWVP